MPIHKLKHINNSRKRHLMTNDSLYCYEED